MWCPVRFPHNDDVRFDRLDSHLFCRGFLFYLCYLYLLTYTGVQHDFHTIWSFISYTTGVTCGAPEFTPGFSRVRVARCLVFCVVLCRLLFGFCPVSVDHCVVCSSSIWYLQTFSYGRELGRGINILFCSCSMWDVSMFTLSFWDSWARNNIMNNTLMFDTSKDTI
jgi:hypothetical protein